MCLDTIYRGKEKREALAKLPESGHYWKVVRVDNEKYKPPCFSGMGYYAVGWNKTTRRGGAEYPVAFHLFPRKIDAKHWLHPKDYPNDKVIRCKVEKKNIIAIGLDEDNSGLCIVTTRFWCPKPR